MPYNLKRSRSPSTQTCRCPFKKTNPGIKKDGPYVRKIWRGLDGKHIKLLMIVIFAFDDCKITWFADPFLPIDHPCHFSDGHAIHHWNWVKTNKRSVTGGIQNGTVHIMSIWIW